MSAANIKKFPLKNRKKRHLISNNQIKVLIPRGFRSAPYLRATLKKNNAPMLDITYVFEY